MEEQVQDPTQEIRRLQRCINDLVSLLALPAIWSGNAPSQILEMLLDALLRMLSLDFIWARLKGSVTAAPIEILRVADSCKPKVSLQDIGVMLNPWLKGDGENSLPPTGSQFHSEGIAMFPVPLGIHGEVGMLVVGSERADFPSQTESLLLSVAANQASIGLREAAILREQKRIAHELDRRVAERTAELAAANEELKEEIAERMLAEERLRQEEQELRRSELHKATILDSSPDCVVAIDHEGCITEFNPAAEQTFGHPRKDVLGRRLADVIIPPSFREKHHAGFARYVSTGESKVLGRRLEMTALCADGSEIPVELTITRMPQDGPLAFTGHIRDITERKRSEEALRVAHAQVLRSEERWRSVFESSAVGVALTDLSGRFIAANPIFQKMLGYTEQELQQLTSPDVTHEDDLERNQALIRELLGGQRQQFQIEKQYRRKDGKSVWARNNVSIVPGTERVPRFLMALSEDITQWKLSEEALARARSELAKVASITSLGVLTASIAHEVNQPLSGIVTNASTCLRMLSADPPNVDGARETVRRTIRDGNRASDVITRLRTLYSKKEPSPETMDLNEAAREVAALSLIEIQRSGAILRYELADNLPPVVGDRVQLQQVILNLLRNAADAMSTIDDRPRELLIRTDRDEGNQVRLSVKDSGVGLTSQAADRIFEAFYTTKADGMGIGLSVSRSIIEAHQGRLWATPNDGPGSTFSFAIPSALEGLADTEARVHQPDPSKEAA
ncbi:MAG TPA: PAS domain S-box protein [Candidatus Sulfotelmatobacter sp.]|nr:PAS domain S-box protein [Candidatus Sulfotelmatobacter sp.]